MGLGVREVARSSGMECSRSLDLSVGGRGCLAFTSCEFVAPVTPTDRILRWVVVSLAGSVPGYEGAGWVRPVLLVDADGPLNPHVAKAHQRSVGYVAHRLVTQR